MEALEEEVARAAAGRWAADVDGGERDRERDDETADEASSEGASSDSSAVDEEDLPSRLVGMLDVERPAW
jgi:hypothetical protein